KGLLDTNPKTRFTAKQALQASCFHGLGNTQQVEAFEELRRETFAQHRGIETSQVNLSNYEWVRKMAPEEEKAQKYQSTSNQEFYGYELTPEGYQLTPDHVTAGSSSSSGHQLTP
nr:hypothetical protein [Chlamydiota bacterium]